MFSERISDPGGRSDPDTALRILIVDDSDADAFLFEQVANEIGTQDIDLEHCFGFEDALQALRRDVFDVAFVDYQLGTHRGTDLIAAAGGRECDTPLILLTGQFGWATERQGIEAGAVDFIDKNTLSPALLRRAIGFAQTNHGKARELVRNLESYRTLAASTERASARKSLFFAEMSHELRTPLNAIIGFSELLKDQLLGPMDGSTATRYAGYADDIHTSSKHLLSLIDDLLDLSKFEAGEVEPNMSRVGVNDLVDELANDRLVFAVTDNGCGIPADELKDVLLPYRQGSTMESRHGRGTGLGLALTNSILETHQGYLSLESTEGVGTTIRLHFPVDRI